MVVTSVPLPPGVKDTIKWAVPWARLGLRSWLRVGLWTLLSTSAPPERSENVKQVGLWVHLEPRLPVMLPPECSENVKQAGLRVGLWALCSVMLPP